MPVPKRKTSKSRRDMRQSCKFIRNAGFSVCASCSAPQAGHQVCSSCGFYKGKKVLFTKKERLTIRTAKKQKEQAMNDLKNSSMKTAGTTEEHTENKDND